MKTALVFPGQGSQAVGMGKRLADAFPAARDVFARVDAALGEKLSQLVFEGPEAELTLTANAQPALMATSLAALRALESETGLVVARDAAFVAGHSLGEYSALCAAGTLTIEDAARLLRIRGRAMQKAVPVGEGAMAAILGLDFAEVSAIALEAASELYLTGAICEAANDNGGGQVVISGTTAAVERAMSLAKFKGAKRALLLPVSAPFHCTLMRPARARSVTPRRFGRAWSRRSQGRCAGAKASPIWRTTASRASSRSAPARCLPASSSASRPARRLSAWARPKT
jgi:[acyl-carrier-protein] S-malonyltransferase